MKYNDIDWSRYNEKPSQEVYEAWLEMRKHKRAKVTQVVINGTAKHVNKLLSYGYTADQCFTLACENAWQGMKWVVESEAKTGFRDGERRQVSGSVVTLNKSTRDMSLEQELNDREWALDHEDNQ